MKAKDVRKGDAVIYNGVPYRVMDFHHHTPGNLRAHVQTKLRNLLTGTQTEVKFSSTEELPEADVYAFDATYLYADGDGFHFMNTSTFDQVTLSKELVGDGSYYLQDEMKVKILSYNDAPIGVELPKSVVLVIKDTEPEVKGATVSNVGKPATTTSGLSLTVPPFIKVGERIEVSTETGEFMSRAD